LVIRDGVAQLFDRSGQDFGVISIAQEPNERVLFSERLKLRNDPLELPERGINELIYVCLTEYEPLKFHSPSFLSVIVFTDRRGEHTR